LTEIELLAQQHPRLQIVISSRPDSGIERSAHFRVYQLATLTPQDHRPFLELITTSAQRATEIQGAIRKSSSDVKSLLQTPLLLTLLVIVYNAREEVPSSLSEFYEALFHTLLMRHDKTKPGFKRKRDSGLSDPELKKLFEAFCYAARQHDLLVLSDSTLAGLLEQASKVTGIACEGDAFSNDITKVACLMQQEGFQYHFIHKSVAEFHAASFISKTSEENAIRFYSAMSSRTKWSKWRQELEFLSQLDRYRYLRYFYVPSTIEAFRKLGVGDDGLGEISEEVAKEFLNSLQVVVFPREASQPGIHFRFMPGTGEEMRGFVLDTILMDTFHEAFNLCRPHTRLQPTTRSVLLGDYIAESGHLKTASAIVRNVVKNGGYILKTCKAELEVEKKVAEFVSP